jgi:hypothetical protein
MKIECKFEPPHIHEFPEDWLFDGANGLDPRADNRWRPTTYVYYDCNLAPIFLTQTPLCDDQAIEEFTKVAKFGKQWKPVYLAVKRPDMTAPEMLGWKYDKETDEVTEI